MTSNLHHLDDPHYGAQADSLNVHPLLPMTLTLLTARLEVLHNFRTQGLLEAPEVLIALVDLVDHPENHLSLLAPFLISVLSVDTITLSTSNSSNP